MKQNRIIYIDNNGIKHNLKDLTGQCFGRLTPIKVIKVDEKRGATWLCQCSCGNTIELIGSKLTTGTTKSCGCLRIETARKACYKNHKRNISVHIGEKYGHLTILQVKTQNAKGKSALCLCQCDCGSEPKWIDAHSLRRGCTTSCGCIVSQGENKIKDVLHQLQINFISQKTFIDCINPKTGRRLKFDFYLPDYNCCIEYDGRQHFYKNRSKRGWFSDKKIIRLKYRDNIKNVFCIKNHIRLIRIPYTEFNNIDTVFIKSLLLNNNKQFDVLEY